jgi:bifunctional non-homologous end joining protein LigD
VKRPAGGTTAARTAGTGSVVAGVTITHPDRVLYPRPRVTKLDVARYYEAIAERMLPHLADRPTTLVRCPDGIEGECFYQRHAGASAAATAMRRVPIPGGKGEALVLDSRPALISAAQLGILEIHTWNATVSRIETPDRVVFDLDPGPGVTWARVVDAARLVRQALAAVGLEGFVKTSGGKGLHVVAPLAPVAWKPAADFAAAVAEALAQREPDRFTTTVAKSERPGRIYIDHLRNRRAASTVAAYSTRARPGAPVSMPLAWEDLSARVTADRFTVATVPSLARGKDPWARYWTLRQRLPNLHGPSR